MKYPIGTIRHWKSGNKVKTAQGWVATDQKRSALRREQAIKLKTNYRDIKSRWKSHFGEGQNLNKFARDIVYGKSGMKHPNSIKKFGL